MNAKPINVFVLAVCASFGSVANACIPPFYHSAYLGKTQFVNDEVDDEIRADIKASKATVIEDRIGLLRYALVRKGDLIYLDGVLIATKVDSFWYLGHGYYQLNGGLYYLGERVGNFPREGTSTTHAEDRTTPLLKNPPPGVMNCLYASHANIFDSSSGLHIERLVADN